MEFEWVCLVLVGRGEGIEKKEDKYQKNELMKRELSGIEFE
jgi:hypothetical protein